MTKIVFISGASSGIGRAAAQCLAAGGYDLILAARRAGRLQELSEELKAGYGIRVLPLSLDVMDQDAVRELVGSLPEEWQAVDVLVNNAGLALGMGPLWEGDEKDWDQMIGTNIKGLLCLSKAIIPGMIARKSGHVINIGSIAGKQAYINGNVYCATKAAVDALSRSMRMELLPYGIKVSQLAPGAVETEFSEVRFKGDRERATKVYRGYEPLKAEDVAAALEYIIRCPPHVCVNDLLLMPTAQADAVHWNKKNP